MIKCEVKEQKKRDKIRDIVLYCAEEAFKSLDEDKKVTPELFKQE